MDTAVVTRPEAEMQFEDYIQPFNLTQSQAKLLALLMEVSVASGEMIHKRVASTTEPKVAVHRLRKQLKPHGINVYGKRFKGFWMEPDDKDKVTVIMRSSRR